MRQNIVDLLTLHWEAQMANVHISIPGKINSYDHNKKQAGIIPLIQKKFANGDVLPYPVIENVPVIFPGTVNSIISVPVKKGDPGLLIFSEKSLERWLSSNIEDVEPGDPRRFNLSDAIFIPGLFTFSNPGRIQKNPDDIEIANDSGKVIVQDGGKDAARKDDTVASTGADDSAYWAWVINVSAVLNGLIPGSVPSIPTSLTGKITGGSTKVEIG